VKGAMRRGPGEIMRALHLADLQYYHGPGLLSDRFLLSPVLASQPIMEFCCQIPAYRTVEGGRDRGLARLAFADELPASAVDRRRKGDTTRFHAAVAQANDAFIRDMLRDGELERRGLFNAAAMDKTAPGKLLDFSHHLVAELWLRRAGVIGKSSPRR
jgi:asparagine synthase (glutamine-hydrolysing)